MKNISMTLFFCTVYVTITIKANKTCLAMQYLKHVLLGLFLDILPLLKSQGLVTIGTILKAS